MDAFNSSVMIALLPTTTDWCKIELPHLTLVYCGEIEDLSFMDHNELAKVGLDLALTCRTLSLEIMVSDVFGDDDEKDVDVFLLRPTPQLLAMRDIVKGWNRSQHPFRPHVTVGPKGSIEEWSIDKIIPTSLVFDRVLVAWGNEHIVYSLRG